MLKIYFSILFILSIFSSNIVHAQDNSKDAFVLLTEAKYMFDQKNYYAAFDYIIKAQLSFGEPNARLLNLKVKILYELEEYGNAKQIIEEFGNYEAGEELISDTYSYISKIEEKEKEKKTEGAEDCYLKGINAYAYKNWAIAEKYLTKAVELKYGDGDAVIKLHEVYLNVSAAKKIETNLINGSQIYPDNVEIVNLLINYYLDTQQNGYALAILTKLIKSGYGELSDYYYSAGVIYDNKHYKEDALFNYEKCLELDPEYFNAYFNMGVLFFNEGVERHNIANAEIDFNRFNAGKDIAQLSFKKSLPYFEKALTLKPKDLNTLESLKSLYYRFEMFDKYHEIDSILSSLNRLN